MTRPYPQIGPFTVARGEAPIATSVPVVGLDFKGALVRLTTDETLVTSTAIPWDVQVNDRGGWWDAASATLFVTPANVRQAQFQMGAYLTPAVAGMQFYMLKNGAPFPGGGYSQTASGNVGFTWTSAPVDTVEGDLWEMIPEFAAGAPVLDADEVGGTWLAIEAKQAISPSTARRGALMKLAANETAADYSTAKNIAFDTSVRDTDSFVSVNSLGVFDVRGGVGWVRLTMNVYAENVASGSIQSLKLFQNGAVMIPELETRGQTADTSPGMQMVSYAVPVVSGDWFNTNFESTDAAIDIIAAKSSFGIEVLDPAFMANVDSYHGMYFAGIPTSVQETHRIKAPFAFTIPASLDGATGSIGTAPNSIEVWSFQKDDVEFATATVAIDGGVTFQSSLEQEFGPDTNVLTFVAPNSGSAGNVSFVLKGIG